MGTLETLRCRQEMFLPDREACEIPGWPCKKNSGKCVADGICCTHGKYGHFIYFNVRKKLVVVNVCVVA